MLKTLALVIKVMSYYYIGNYYAKYYRGKILCEYFARLSA